MRSTPARPRPVAWRQRRRACDPSGHFRARRFRALRRRGRPLLALRVEPYPQAFVFWLPFCLPCVKSVVRSIPRGLPAGASGTLRRGLRAYERSKSSRRGPGAAGGTGPIIREKDSLDRTLPPHGPFDVPIFGPDPRSPGTPARRSCAPRPVRRMDRSVEQRRRRRLERTHNSRTKDRISKGETDRRRARTP